MRRTWRKAQPKVTKQFRANDRIRVPQVFLIDANGEKLGSIDTKKALAMAEESGMDLVEVNPKADPPICKIMDYGQFKYEKEKKAQKQKAQQKKVETKGIRLSVRISTHDFNFRKDQAIKFLQKGNKLKIELILKGRERQHPGKAKETIAAFIKEVEKDEALNLYREQDLTKQGGRYTIILANKTS